MTMRVPPATAPRATCRSTSTSVGTELPGRSRTSSSTSSTRARANAPKDKVGENLYNRGVSTRCIIAEAIRNAQKLTGKKVVTGEDMRRGLETLNITAARLKEIGCRRLCRRRCSCPAPTITATHGAYLAQWDGTKWIKASDWIEPIKDKVLPLIDSRGRRTMSSANAGWPKRTEPCDKSS